MKLTGWFDGCIKPVRPGPFRRKYGAHGLVLWACWRDGRWGCAGDTKQQAIARSHIPSLAQCLPWRGIKGPEF